MALIPLAHEPVDLHQAGASRSRPKVAVAAALACVTLLTAFDAFHRSGTDTGEHHRRAVAMARAVHDLAFGASRAGSRHAAGRIAAGALHDWLF